MSYKLKLTYFNSRGRAETTRILLAYGNVSFEDVRCDHAADGKNPWPGTLKAQTPFGQLPVLEVNGQLFAQSRAIELFAAKLVGLYSNDPVEALKIDQVVEGVTDAMNALMKIYHPVIHASKEEQQKAMVPYFQEDQAKLKSFEQLLVKNSQNGGGSSDYFVGNRLTYADVSFFTMAENITAQFADFLKDYPLLTALVKRVAATPAIAKWLKERPVSQY